MKELFTLIMLISFTIGAFSQVPEKMSYQAVIRNASGELVKNSPIGMKISILQGSATGTPMYVETQTPTPNANGLVSLEIGGGTPVTGTFVGIDWSTGTYFIKTETDPIGGTSYTITWTSQILSVPYALFSKSSTDAVKITGNQIISGNKTFSGTTTVITPVNANDAANKAYVDAMKQEIKLEFYAENGVSDIDGNHYRAVKIGTQVWMAENLKTTKYSNGDLIGTTSPATLDISGETTPKYQWTYDGNESNVNTYGRLYTWYAVMDSRNVCSTGWHVPTDAEWTILTDYLGGQSVAGGKLKETGMTHWIYSNSATNESGFTGLPSGIRYNSPYFFSNIGSEGSWWSSTELDNLIAYCLSVYSNTISVRRGIVKYFGLSVRCLRDN